MSFSLSSPAFTAPAAAQAPLDEPAYTELIRRALDELNGENYVEARALFLKAHAMLATARTARALGNVEFELHHYTAAARYFETALRSEVRPLTREMRAEVQQMLTRAQDYTGHFTLLLTPARASVTVDDAAPELDAEQRLWLDVGMHELSFSAEGFASKRLRLTVSGGEHTELRVALTSEPALQSERASQPAPAVSSEPRRADSGAITTRWWFWTAIGVVAVGAAVGVTVAATSGKSTQPPLAGNLGKVETLLVVRR